MKMSSTEAGLLIRKKMKCSHAHEHGRKEHEQVQLSEHAASAVPQAPRSVGTSLSHDHLPIAAGDHDV